jgi:hypothetical protein
VEGYIKLGASVGTIEGTPTCLFESVVGISVGALVGTAENDVANSGQATSSDGQEMMERNSPKPRIT